MHTATLRNRNFIAESMDSGDFHPCSHRSSLRVMQLCSGNTRRKTWICERVKRRDVEEEMMQRGEKARG
jgi:hypothetical protein